IFIPKPWELGMVFGSAPERMMQWALEHDPHAFDGLAEDFQEAFLPGKVWPPEGALGWLPDVLLPWIEAVTNHSTFLNRPIVPEGEQNLLPPEQYGSRQTHTSREIGALLGVSPRKVEHVVRGYSAGLGMY